MRTVSASVFKLHRMFGYHEMMTCDDCLQLKFKVKVTMTLKVIMGQNGTNVISFTVLNTFSLSLHGTSLMIYSFA